jgi:hypothetical protein
MGYPRWGISFYGVADLLHDRSDMHASGTDLNYTYGWIYLISGVFFWEDEMTAEEPA